MYLTGQEPVDLSKTQLQAIAPPGIFVDRSVDVKDRLNRFTALPENIWNNPHRTSAKSHKFYHAKEVEFKCKSNYHSCNLPDSQRLTSKTAKF